MTPVRADPLIHVDSVFKTYGKVPAEVSVLRGVSLDVRAGERVALLGKSGSGKSTLLHLIGGLDIPTSGNIVVAGHNLGQMTRGQLAEYRAHKVGMIFQAFHLVPTQTALQNVELPMIFAGIAPDQRRERAIHALRAVELGHRLDHRPSELSGGEKQRVAIARAVVMSPAILLADEPTGNLDSRTADGIVELLLNHIQQHHTTLVIVTHDEDIAHRSAQRILHIQDGELIEEERG